MRGALVAGVVLTVALAGCGGGSDESKVKDATNAFVGAIRAQDGQKACSYLTDDGRATYTQLGDLPCEQGVLKLGIVDGNIRTVQVRGKEATVVIKDSLDRQLTLLLEKQGDSWKVKGTG